jgi:diketogulonate reductase-like aldo/keto reductase
VTGALTKPCVRLNATPGQVLFLWVRAKGAVVVTTTSREERLREYLGIGDLGMDV